MVRHISTIAAVIFVLIGAALTGGVRVHASDPAIYVVTNTNNSGPGSLRDALGAAGSDGVPSTIIFNIPPTETGFNGQWFTIRPASPLPWLTDGGTTIDGASQISTNPLGPSIVINGSLAGGGSGLVLASDGNHVNDLVVNAFTGGGSGIDIRGSNNSVTGSYVGVDPTGTTAVENRFQGIAVFSGTGNVIGGSSPAERNVISGNNGQGIHLASPRNTVRGNFIGTDRTGTVALGNGLEGVFIWPCPYAECAGPAQGNVVGGPASADRNVISGNRNNGVWLEDTDNVVQGNFIGTDVTGTRPLGNAHDGVKIVSAPAGCAKGNCSPEASGDRNVVFDNLISANGENGIGLWAGDTTGPTSDDNVIQGNFIGTDVTGMVALGNQGRGISIRAGSNNRIGGLPGEGNLISGNVGAGVFVSAPSFAPSTANVIQGNRIGTDASGMSALANGSDGITLGGDGVVGTLIGGTASGTGNVISGNSGDGIGVSSASDTIVQGNFIGTNASGTAAVANGTGTANCCSRSGVVVVGTRTLIGGTTAAARNVISGNTGDGVNFAGSSVDNSLQGNYIGTDVTGSAAIPNAIGVFFKVLDIQPTGNIIGGSVAGAGNLISGNREAGIALGGTQNVIEGNRIGTDAAGSDPLPNGGAGVRDVFVCNVGCTGNVIGPANTIAFNGGAGIRISNPMPVLITRNSIFANAALGIDLAGIGVTPNDPGDLVWPQNFPVLGTAEVAGGVVTVTGALDTQSPATAAIELFGNDAADLSGYGQGQRYVAAVTTAANGCFSVTFPAAAADRFFTGTATSASFGTSEFSRAIPQGTTKAAIALAPATATNVVGTTHTVTATLTNTAGGPVPCATITFTVTGANTASGTATTDINGTTSFTYTGVWAGEDTIAATSAPATGTATKTWTFPPSTAGRVTGGGQVPTPTSRASFGLTASGPTGQLEFNEKTGRNVHSTRIAATVITGTHATVYGFATVNGAGDVQFRVEADDLSEPGTNDVFRIVMRDGYTAGGVLQNGNIQIQ